VLKIAGDTPVPVEARVSDVPAGVGAVVRRAMARNRNDRYASVVEMARALALFANASDRAVAQFASASDPSRFSAPATSSNRARSAASGSAGARGPWFATTQRTSTPFASESVSGSRRPQPLLGRVSVRVLGAAAMLLFGLTALALWWRPDERRPEQRPPPSPSTTTAAASAPPRDTTSPTFVPIPSAAALKPAEPVIAQPPPSAASKAIATEPPPPRRHRARSLPPPAAVSNAPPEVVAPAPRAIDDKPHGRPRPSLGRADF
jgi:serine/threonine-protein kinase